MVSVKEDINGIKKISLDVYNENNIKWITCVQKTSNPLSSILKMMDNIQSELLQAQIDLQDGQHQIQKIESIFQFDQENVNISNFVNTFQLNKNDNKNNKLEDLQNEIIVIQNDNKKIKNHLEIVINTNVKLQSGIVAIENELKKKDQILQVERQEMKKVLLEKRTLESNIFKLNAELNGLKNEYKEKLSSLKNKVYTKELAESKLHLTQEELQKQIQGNEIKISNQEKTICQYKEINKTLESKIDVTKRSVKNGMQKYETKVKTIIEEIKKQKHFIEEENQKLTGEFEASKKELCESRENCELLSLKLLNKEDEIFQLKTKLVDKTQYEEREKLFKRELDENINQIRNYKTQIINLNSEKETYYNKICEQDNSIYKLIEEIRSLHNQMKTVKNQAYDQIICNDSTYTSTIGRPNQSTPTSQSTSADLNEQSQSPVHYNSEHHIENCGDKYHESNEEIINHSDYDSLEDNTIKKLANLLKEQAECTKNYLSACGNEENFLTKDQNTVLVIDDFSKYLEEQLQLIKIANERNMITIKRELTIK